MTKELFQKTVLPNGLRIVTESMPWVRSAALGIWVDTGPVRETIWNNGISHFLEHMLFKGTSKRSAKEIAMSLEALGGHINGSTGKENSLYSAYSLDQDLEVAIDVLSDLVQDARLDDRDIELERQVVLAEINQAKEDPEEMILDHLYANLFPDHPLGYFIYGAEANVRAFSRSQLIDFYKDHYTPENIVVSAAGNIEHDRVVDAVERYYRNGHHHNGSNGTLPDLPQNFRNGKIVDKSLHQAHVALGARTFGFNHPQRFALVLLDILLGGGMSSRLFQNIREQYGFCYTVYSFSDFMRKTGVFGFYIACAPDKVDESIGLIKKELDQIARGAISEEELAMIKSQIRGGILLGQDSSNRRMRKIGEREIYQGPLESVDEVLEQIDRVTVKELQKLVTTYFQDDQLSTMLIVPR
jgi:predicted Zn-dependent peptidase